MPKPRTPTDALKLKGAYKDNPKREQQRADEPKPDAGDLLTAEAPEWMTAKQRKCYREIVRNCHKDVLTTADGVWVEITACLLSEYRDNPALMKISKVSRLMSALAQLGMTPTDRARASKVKRQKENKFGQFVN